MITIPIWFITLVVPLLFTILIAAWTNNRKSSASIGSINTSVIEINKRLDRIETKLDNHITKN
jgi:hypothetical protein